MFAASGRRKQALGGQRRWKSILSPGRSGRRSPASISREIADATMASIRRAWLDHLVVFFRDQALAPAQLLNLARRFGEPMEYPFIKGLDNFPEITPVIKLAHERVNFGGLWHSDTSYL